MMIYKNGKLIDERYSPLTYPKFERFMKDNIRDYYSRHPDKSLKPFSPSIPKTVKKIEEAIDVLVDPSQKFTEPITPVELREELLSNIEELGINLNRDLPTEELQSELRKCLDGLSNPERLAIGVFGRPFTLESIEFWNEMKVDLVFLDVVEMILNKEKAASKAQTPRGSIAAEIIKQSLKR